MLRVRVLGSGDAFNGGGALHSAYLLEHAEGTLLLEGGPSVLAALKAAKVDPDSIDAVLISHLHGDHFGGIPFLILEYLFRSHRERPLIIAGPPGTLDRCRLVYSALYKEEHFHKLRFEMVEQEIKPDESFELAGVRCKAFRVPHMAEPYCLGYRLETADGAILFSGDSAWTDEFVKYSKDADVFLCECCSLEPATDFHTSYADILTHRDELGCRRLVLTHLGSDVRAAVDLEVERAYDGMLIEIGGSR